jgi:hypothetical protein
MRNDLQIFPNLAGTTDGSLDVRNLTGNVTVGINGGTGAVSASNMTVTSTLVVDQGGTNTGLGPDLILGDSGQGIGSVHNNGFGDSFGLNFYTDFNKRITILQNGNVGIGTTNATNTLVVAGNVAATSFTGNGAGLTSTVTASNFVYAYDQNPQQITTSNTFLNITFGVNGQLSGWTHTAGSATFTCAQTGTYLIQYNLVGFINTPANQPNTFSTHVIRNLASQVIASSGSQSIAFGNLAGDNPLNISQSFMAQCAASDRLFFQMSCTTTNSALLSFATDTPTASVTITRIQ